MGRGWQQYLYKGWQVRASEYQGGWEVQPYWKDDIDEDYKNRKDELPPWDR